MKENKILVCQDCCRKFVFTTVQQEHFEANGWPAPKRCPNCRAAKKERAARAEIYALMRGGDMRLHSRHGRGFFAKLHRPLIRQ